MIFTKEFFSVKIKLYGKYNADFTNEREDLL